MKILLLTDFYLPTIGGAERHVASLGKDLSSQGHEVVVCTIRQKDTVPFEVYDGIYVYRLNALFEKIPFAYSNPLKKFHPPLKDPKIAAQIEKIVLNFKPNLIHSHGWIVFSYIPLKSRLQVPLVHTLHHYGFICPKQDLFNENAEICTKPFSSMCYTCCAEQQGITKSILTSEYVKRNRRKLAGIDRFLAVSNFVRKAHIQYLKIPYEKISVIPNFFEFKREEELKSECYKNYLPENFILYVGALMPYKGVGILLEAYRLSNVDLPLVVMGSKHHNYDYGKYHDGKRVFVIEDAPRSLVIEAYEKSEFVVVPSIWADPCPTVALEAMSFSKAVIGSRIGGLTDIIVPNETGYLFEHGKTLELSYAIKRLLEKPLIGRRMGKEGKIRFLKEFSVRKVCTDIEGIYRNLPFR